MEPNENEFSWSAMFIVTACCFFIFNAIVKLLDGDFSPALFIVALTATFLGLLNGVVKMILRQTSKKEEDAVN